MDNAAFSTKLNQLGLDAFAVNVAPSVPAHKIGAPRIALMHTWISTQTEGWWRQAFDKLGIPYSYISTQTVAREDNLRGKYDAILFAPIDMSDSPGGAGITSLIVNGTPLWGAPIPWKVSALTPNMGIDQSDDIRPGLGAAGVAHLQRFVEQGGLFLAAGNVSKFAIDMGLAPGVAITPTKDLRVVGSALRAVVVDASHPVSYGYTNDFAVFSANGLSFTVSNLLSGDEDLPNAKDYKRPTGRGGPRDTDIPEARGIAEAADLPAPKPWEATPLNPSQMRADVFFPYLVIPPEQRPHAVLRFADADDLLVAGLLAGGGAMAERAAVVDARRGNGHSLLFAINPIWRGETVGSYALVFNALLNFDHMSDAH